MKNSMIYILAGALFVLAGLPCSGCSRNAQVVHPLANITLVPPYPVMYPDAPSDRISVQYAVLSIARQAGIEYEWDASFKNTDPVCRKWITPVISRQTFPAAIRTILDPENLTYTITEGKIILGRKN